MINAASAYAVFKEINTLPKVDKPGVYWLALDAERWGHITVAEMDAIVVHRDEIVSMHDDDTKWANIEAREMEEVRKAMADSWRED